MTKHRRESRKQQHAGRDGQIRWPAMLRAIVLCGGVALLVLTAMLPSESAISHGTYAPLAAGWCLLLILWAASICCEEKPTIRLGWTEIAGVALVGWHSLAALACLGQTNGRHALNAHWLLLGYALTAFLLRQTVRTARESRGIIAAMLWLATLLASFGLYQYFYSSPLQRREYERDPQKYLAENQISTDVNSPEAQHFRNRVFSVEPLATFGLTNSLAGVLAPWLLAALAIAYANAWSRPLWPAVSALAVAALILAACLILTKSRTAYLAVFAGVLLLLLFGGSSTRWRLNWKIPAALAGVAVILGLAAVFFGGLDAEVLSEAPKSVLYRLEYWRATARIIAQFPLFGCGPGNFQEAFAAYKLPEASEMPADPHNFLLEIWATAGTPAVILLVALLFAFAADIAAAQPASSSEPEPDELEAVAAPEWLVLAGTLIGLLLASPIAAAVTFPLAPVSDKFPLPVLWLLGAPLLAASWWLLLGWMRSGDLPLSAVVIPQIVLLINFLAAGAIVFPAVISTLLVLLPIAIQLAAIPINTSAPHPSPRRSFSIPGQISPPRALALVVLLGAVVMAANCLYTDFYPVLNGRQALDEALYRLQVQDFRNAPAKVVAAAEADSLSPEPRQLLADLLFGRWEASQSDQDWQAFVEAADSFRRSNPRHHVAWFTRGNWFLTAWKKSHRHENLTEAIQAYREASLRYPNHALYHAQLAWTLHLAGDDAAAQAEAEKAHQLDQKMPHQELKLAKLHVTDPDFSQKPTRPLRNESAEQTVERLRNSSATGTPPKDPK
jgi:O-antigen ligase